jgi:uncharacterized protein (DUF983 family)
LLKEKSLNEISTRVCPHCSRENIYKNGGSEPVICGFCGKKFEEAPQGSDQKRYIFITGIIFGIVLFIAVIVYLVFNNTKLDYYVSQVSTQIRSTKLVQPDAINWDQAKNFIGESKTVCGPVVSTKYASSIQGEPTYLDLGTKNPDPARLTVIIWGDQRTSFSFKPEEYFVQKKICVSGLIVDYKGTAEIEIKTPTQITIQ